METLNKTWDGTYLCDKHLESAGDTTEAVPMTDAMVEADARRIGAAPACDSCLEWVRLNSERETRQSDAAERAQGVQ